jgi:hypothetical protein
MFPEGMEPAPISFIERHYTVGEIAAQWHFDDGTIRRLFIDEPGVLHLSQPTRLLRRGDQSKYVRRYGTIRIPESVFERVRDRLTAKRSATVTQRHSSPRLPVGARQEERHG